MREHVSLKKPFPIGSMYGIIYLHERWKMDKTGHMNNGKWLGKYSRPTWILSFARRSEEFTCNSTASGDGNSIGSNATSTMLLWILGKFIGKKKQIYSIHVWYIYLHLPLKSTKCKVNIHGWYGKCFGTTSKPTKTPPNKEHLHAKLNFGFISLKLAVNNGVFKDERLPTCVRNSDHFSGKFKWII